MSGLVALALDVPRRLSRAVVLWLLILGALFLTVGVTIGIGVEPYPLLNSRGARVTILFGLQATSSASTGPAELLVEFLSFHLGLMTAGFLFGTAAVLATADSVTRAFMPGAAEVTVTKPLSRAQVVLGRTLGSFLVIAGIQATIVLVGAGLAHVRTGLPTGSATLVLPFAVLAMLLTHGVATFFGVLTRNPLFTVLAALGVVVGSAMIFAFHVTATQLRDDSGVLLEGRWEVLFRVTRMTFPRVVDLLALGYRVAKGQHLDLADDVPIVVNGLVWLVAGYGATALVLRKRDL